MYSLARSQQLRLAESAKENAGLLNPLVFLQQHLSSMFPLPFHEMVVFAAHHEMNPHQRTPKYAVRFYTPFNCLVNALPIYFNDAPININEDLTECYEITNKLIMIPYLYGHNEDNDIEEANRDALPCGRDLVTNNPGLIIKPDNDNDDLELYGAPVQPSVKPHFIDVARLANAWCQHYPGVIQREHQNVVQVKDDGHQQLMYPTPPPQYNCFDPIIYPEPWDNNLVPKQL
jgi:hypothetical protein